MAGNFVDSLVIGIGLDTSQIAQGVQQVGAQLDSGLSAAAQSAASKMSPLGEALKGLADKAGEVAKPAKESLQALHGLGLKAASEYQEQIDAIKAGLAQIQNDPALSASDKASAMDAASAKIDELKTKMDGLKEPASEAMQVLKDLGIRTTEEIQKSLDALKAKLAAVQNDPALTARDKMAAMKELQAQIERTEMELKRGLPQAAAQGFAGAEAAANKFKGFMSSIWAQVSGPLLGAFATGNAISSYISNSVSAGELADKLKVDIEEIQIWSGAMDRAGGSAASLQATIEKLNASGKAQGDAIGVLLDLADKADTMSKEAFVQKAKDLEIDEKTIEVLAQGRKALDEHLKRQRELGAYTKEDAEQSKKFKQSLADLLQAWDSFTSFIGRFTVPIMRVLADALTAVVVFMRQHTAFVVAAITMIGAALAVRLLPPLRTLPTLIANVGKAFLRWLPFVAIITAIALLVEDFWVYLQGGESELAEFWAIFGTGPEILEKLNAAWKETKAYIAAIGTGLAQLVRYWYDLMQASGMFAALGETFKGLLQILKGIFTLDWSLLGEGLSNVLNGMVRGVAATFKGLGILVQDLVKAIWNALRDSLPGFAEWGDGIAEIFEGIVNFDFGKLLSGIGNMLSGAGSMLAAGLKSWLNLCANAWSAIIEVFTGQKIDLAGWVNEAWDKAAAKLAEIKNWVLGWISSLFGDGEAPDFGKLAADIWDGITSAFDGLVEWVKDVWDSLFDFDMPDFGQLASAVWNGITGAFNGLVEWVSSWFKGLFGGAQLPDFAGIAKGIWDGITGAFNKVKEWVGNWFKNLFSGIEIPSIGDILGGAGDLAKTALGGAAGLAKGAGDLLGKGLDLGKDALGKAGDLIGSLLGDAKEGASKVGAQLGPMLRDGLAQAQETFGKGFDLFKGLLGDAKDGAQKVGDALGPALQGGLEIAKKGMGALEDFFGTVFGDAQPATDEAGGKIESGMARTAGLVRDGFNAAWQATAGYGVQAFQGAAVTIQQIFAGIVSGIEAQVGNLVAGVQAMGAQGGMVPAFAGVRAQQGGSRNISNTQNNRITIHAPGGDPRAVQQGVQRGLSQSNKTMPAQSGTVPKG